MTTFHWPHVSKSSWWLAGFIFLSLFLHSTAFFLFQVTTPVQPPTPRPSQPVQILTAYGVDGVISKENAALLEWIASEDPALIARVPDVQPPDLLKVPYRPSFTSMRTAPLGVPEEPASVQFPSARDPIALILGNQSPPLPPSPPLQRQGTKIVFSSTLTSRAPGAGFAPAVKSPQAVQPTRLLLGINAEGEVRFTFLQQPPSGDPALDAEAVAFTRQLRFAPAASNTPIAWGFATFQWGDDATASP